MVSAVIEDVDDALRAFLAAEVAGGRTTVSFEPPTPEWEKSVKGPTLALFLIDVRENLEARTGDWRDVRDDDGILVGRQPPVRRFDLSYLVSAWGESMADQHRLLGGVLGALPAYDHIPDDHIGGRLAEQGISVGLRVGTTDSLPDLWGSIGQSVRACATLLVTMPVLPAMLTELAPPADSMDLGLAGQDGRRGQPPSPAQPEKSGSTEPHGPKDKDKGKPEKPSKADGGQWSAYRTREHIQTGK
jgi:hypothetical protein